MLTKKILVIATDTSNFSFSIKSDIFKTRYTETFKSSFDRKKGIK